MRVNLAAQVLSASVAAVLKAFTPPDTAATAQLCEMVDSFFDCIMFVVPLSIKERESLSLLHTPLCMMKGSSG